ncbi:hypothetical protein [Plectonema radiosum]|uniref:hypothetical protein n=1 Tax=Plectonema radiosum TaxID=945768 RepID=UPI0035C8F9EB
MKAIFADLQKHQAECGREVVSLSRKRDLTTRWGGRAKNLGSDAKDTSCRST